LNRELKFEEIAHYFFCCFFSYKQAQAAVAKALPKLQELGIATKRPEDYFAEMVKTDDHMQRVININTTS